MGLSINGLDVASMTWFAPWSGVWIAECELFGTADTVPSGKVAIVSDEGIALSGTVDPSRTGTFGEKRFVRVLGGGAGWQKAVRAQHYHSDAGVQLQVLASTTAAEVGEVVTVLTPTVVGVDFARRAGPASQIFVDASVDWWVGVDGATRVGVRTPATPHPELEILDWDPAAGTMSFTCPVLVEPGTTIVDDRFGSRVVRNVQARVSNGSVTGTLWVAESAPAPGATSELVDGLAILARAATRIEFARFYEYRVIAMAGDRVQLQAVSKADGVPDMLPASVWAGISGYRATLTPASKVLVGFIGGDPRKPYVAAYEPPEADGWRPVQLELDATAAVKIGERAAAVDLAGGADFVALAEKVLSELNKIKTAFDSHTHTVPIVGAMGTTPSTPPLASMPAPGSVAASKVKAS